MPTEADAIIEQLRQAGEAMQTDDLTEHDWQRIEMAMAWACRVFGSKRHAYRPQIEPAEATVYERFPIVELQRENEEGSE